MAWANQDKTAIVGIGATDYYVRGKSWPRTINDMAGEAILNACADAGISIKDIDGFAYYSTAGAGYLDKFDTASLMETLGMPNVSFSATLTSGGGFSAARASVRMVKRGRARVAPADQSRTSRRNWRRCMGTSLRMVIRRTAVRTLTAARGLTAYLFRFGKTTRSGPRRPRHGRQAWPVNSGRGVREMHSISAGCRASAAASRFSLD